MISFFGGGLARTILPKPNLNNIKYDFLGGGRGLARIIITLIKWNFSKILRGTVQINLYLTKFKCTYSI